MSARWARHEAVRRIHPSYSEKEVLNTLSNWDNYPNMWRAWECLAEMIEKHDQPPVDPDLLVIRKFMAERASGSLAGSYTNGFFDGNTSTQTALAAYKLGKASG